MYKVQCNKLNDDSYRFYVLEQGEVDGKTVLTGKRWKVSVAPQYQMVMREFEDRRDVEGEKGQVFINTEEAPELLPPDLKAVWDAFKSLPDCPKVTREEIKEAYEYVPEPEVVRSATI